MCNKCLFRGRIPRATSELPVNTERHNNNKKKITLKKGLTSDVFRHLWRECIVALSNIHSISITRGTLTFTCHPSPLFASKKHLRNTTTFTLLFFWRTSASRLALQHNGSLMELLQTHTCTLMGFLTNWLFFWHGPQKRCRLNLNAGAQTGVLKEQMS